LDVEGSPDASDDLPFANRSGIAGQSVSFAKPSDVLLTRQSGVALMRAIAAGEAIGYPGDMKAKTVRVLCKRRHGCESHRAPAAASTQEN